METDKTKSIERIYTIWGIILIVWSLYRANLRLPEAIDELFAKPLVFLGPVFFYVFLKEKRDLASIGISGKHLKRDVYFSLGFFFLFIVEIVIANLLKTQKFSLIPAANILGMSFLTVTILSLVTAFNEEVLVRGFLFTRLKEGYGNELKAMLVSAAMYLALLIPIIFTVTKLTGAGFLIFVVSNIVLSVANTMIFSETKTITLPLLIHAFWNMAVVLYL